MAAPLLTRGLPNLASLNEQGRTDVFPVTWSRIYCRIPLFPLFLSLLSSGRGRAPRKDFTEYLTRSLSPQRDRLERTPEDLNRQTKGLSC